MLSFLAGQYLMARKSVSSNNNTSKHGENDKSKLTKTETITFRLPSKLISELKKDAELEGSSLNGFVNKIFTNHIQWERYERKVGLLPMTEPFLKKVLGILNEEQVIDLAQKVESQRFKDIFYFMKNKPDIDDFIDVLRYWLTVSWMQHNIQVGDQSINFKIQHNLGRKWSLYVKTLLTVLSADILGKRAEINTVSDTVISIDLFR